MWFPRTAFIVMVICSSPAPSCSGHRSHSPQLEAEVLSRLNLGMSEAQLIQLTRPIAFDIRTVTWGGTGAHRLYLRLDCSRQIWFEISGGPSGTLWKIGQIEPLSQWPSPDGGSSGARDESA